MTFNPRDHMIKIQGRDYLNVAWRIVWFRDAHPKGTIETHLQSTEPLIVRAMVLDGDGHTLATGFGSADAGGRRVVWSGREIEKAETAAIGRALAHAGFGTQFTGDDEGDNLADSPVERSQPTKTERKQSENGAPVEWTDAILDKVVKAGFANANKHAENMLAQSKVLTPDMGPYALSWAQKYRENRNKKVSKTKAVQFADNALADFLAEKE